MAPSFDHLHTHWTAVRARKKSKLWRTRFMYGVVVDKPWPDVINPEEYRISLRYLGGRDYYLYRFIIWTHHENKQGRILYRELYAERRPNKLVTPKLADRIWGEL